MADPRKTTLPLDSTERKARPLFRGLLRYFPAALAEVARLSAIGNDKHNPGEEMYHARWKSTDQADCILRHLVDMAEDFGAGVGRDEQGIPQAVYVAWRALALAQEWLEKHDGAPLAPGAKLPEQTYAQKLGALLKQSAPTVRGERFEAEVSAHMAAREKAQAPDGHGQCERRSIDDATREEWDGTREGVRSTCIADTSCGGCESCRGARPFPQRQPCTRTNPCNRFHCEHC